MNNIKNKIFKICESFDPNQYENIDLNRLAVYTIWYLNENNIAITLENIIVSIFLMFPEKFSLVGYKEYPDSNRVNRTLLQLRPKYRNWATGDVQRGFVLTEGGRIVLEQTKNLLNNPNNQSKKIEPSKPRTRSLKTEMENIINSPIFQKYIQKREDEISKMEVWEFLGAVPHTPPSFLREYMNKLRNEAEDSGHEQKAEVINFLRWVQKEFSSVFSEKK